jgi:hypothetical protein
MSDMNDKKTLFQAADGPECIHIYTSHDGGVVNFCADSPALFVELTVDGVYTRVGPFHLGSIRQAVEQALCAPRDAQLEKALKEAKEREAAENMRMITLIDRISKLRSAYHEYTTRMRRILNDEY